MMARARSYAQYRKANRKLKEQTTIDLLTGLVNIKGLRQQLEKELSFVHRHAAGITVMSIGIDGFKDLFIRIGRAGAEAIIKKVGTVLMDSVRKEDTVARSGVHNFTVTMPLTQGENALELADRICQKVEAFKAKLEGKRIKITVSIGVCVVEPHSEADLDTVLSVSEEALYCANQLGRSQLYQLTVNEYKRRLAEQEKHTMSIDALLDKINGNEQNEVLPVLDVALERLSPLIRLLSNEQKQRVISYR